jgi:PAS domain S-box-containing protein
VNEAADDPMLDAQVRAEQVRTLYRQSTPVLLANVVNALIISVALWSRAQHPLLLAWTATITVMVLVRIQMRQRYWSRDWRLDEQERWGTRFSVGSLCAGALWGIAGGALMPDSLPHQILIIFVLGGMAAGAAGSIACFMPAYYAYLIPSLLPAVARLLWFGASEEHALAAMLLFFSVALSLVAHNVNRAFSDAFRLRFENAALYRQVSNAQASVVIANANLRHANEQLETRVRERTDELRASEARLAEMVSESPDAIVVFDDSGRILSANAAAERISGQPLAALIGKHIAETETLTADDLKRASEAFDALRDDESRSLAEYRIHRTDGQPMVVEIKLRVVRGLDGERRVHTVCRDVTERHRLQRLKDAYEVRLREAERLESVSMLAGGVAHDFNNLLTTILGNVDLLDRSGDEPPPKAMLAEIRHASMQAANLTKQLLAFSRQQLLDVHPTDLTHVVADARATFERALGERSTLSIKLPVEPMVVLVDATQIEQAILNLLINARHAMPDGGRVDLELRRDDLTSESDWPEAESGPYVRLTVSDSGTGMDEATRKRIFEPFFTTKALGRGTGLGLSSVHGVIKQAGGYIRVTSALGCGTRFEIVLPYHSVTASHSTRPDAAAWTPGSGAVLLVEDQPQVRNAFERILKDAGYQVFSAEGGQQALDIAKSKDGRFDLLVTDIIMPDISGIELSGRLLALYPHLAVLLMSGYAGSEITRLTELGDSVHFLQKPFDAASLTSAAQAALKQARATLQRDRTAILTN